MSGGELIPRATIEQIVAHRDRAPARRRGVPLVRIAEKVGVTVNGARNMVRRGSGA